MLGNFVLSVCCFLRKLFWGVNVRVLLTHDGVKIYERY